MPGTFRGKSNEDCSSPIREQSNAEAVFGVNLYNCMETYLHSKVYLLRCQMVKAYSYSKKEFINFKIVSAYNLTGCILEARNNKTILIKISKYELEIHKPR